MPIDHLQDINSRLSEYPEARAVATRNLSTHQLALELARILALRALRIKCYGGAVVAATVFSAFLAFSHNGMISLWSQNPDRNGFALFVILVSDCLGSSIVALTLCSVLFWALRGFHKEHPYIEALSPIAQTDLCAIALKALQEGGPDVAVWRDAAIAERGQLYGFDVAVMSCLREKYRCEMKTVEAAEKNAKACALVHQVA